MKRNPYVKVLKRYFSEHLGKTRTKLGLTQAEMAERLKVDERSYVELDHGAACCGAMTLALYLAYSCEDPEEFLRGLRENLEQEGFHVA